MNKVSMAIYIYIIYYLLKVEFGSMLKSRNNVYSKVLGFTRVLFKLLGI